MPTRLYLPSPENALESDIAVTRSKEWDDINPAIEGQSVTVKGAVKAFRITQSEWVEVTEDSGDH